MQRYLEARYAALRDARLSPVFFVEHGLDEPEIRALIADVRIAVEDRPLDSGWWDAHDLPLIVTATEVGYRYRGTGTDFWPTLEERIGVSIADRVRQRIRDRFAAAAETFRGAQPPSTPWAKAFHLIAWPITHALVPLEFHRSLALTLAGLRENVNDLDDESLFRAIRIAAVSSSARFSSLLESPGLIVPVVRSLLGGGPGDLSNEAVQRITEDLAADDLARRSLTAARRVQRMVPKGPSVHAERAVPPIKGTFQLRRRDKALTLEAYFPPIEPQLSSRLRNTLRRRRFAPKLWGVTTRVPSEQLLSGLPFAIKVESAPPHDAPLLHDLESLDIEPDLREILKAFDLPIRTPLLFAIGADKDVGRVVHGPSISGYRAYWVLTSGPSSSLAHCSTLGEIGPYTCYAVDPTNESHLRALTELGYVPRFGVSVAFAGSPPLDPRASAPVFIEGDQRIVLPRLSSPDGLVVELNGSATRMADDEVVRMAIPKGEHVLRVRNATEFRDFAFSGVSTETPSAVAACVINARSADLTVQSLMSGSLAFTIESFAPMENLELTVEFEVGGSRLGASAPLPPLPQIITSKHEPFPSLLDDATRESLLQAQDPMLHLRVGHLCSRTWVLERRISPCWWIQDTEGRFALKSEVGDLRYGAVAVAAPHLLPNPSLHPSQMEACLLAPIELDTSEYGPAALFTTICIAPKSLPFDVSVRPPRLQRRRRGESGAAGLEELVEALLRWSLAESDSLTAEIRRRQVAGEIDAWIAELCCGTTWRNRESELTSQDPWDLLVDIAHQSGLGRDSYLNVPEHVWRESLELAVPIIRHQIPGLWSLARSPSDLVKDDWELVWRACDSAYQSIGRRYREIGDADIASALAEADPSADFRPDEWQAAFDTVLAQTDFASLAALLLPTDTAQGFMTLDATGMSLSDYGEELHRWARESRAALAGDPPSEDELLAIIALWTEPEVAVEMNWRGALDTLISERAVARAARYLALRSRQARRGGAA